MGKSISNTSAVPTSKEWQRIRDKAGGKAGMAKGVSLSDLLDAWHKAMRGKPLTEAALKAVPQANALIKGIQKYRADPAVAKNPKLKEALAQLLKQVDGEIERSASLGQNGKKLELLLKKMLQLTDTIAKMQTTAGNPSANKALQEQYGHLEHSAQKMVPTLLRELALREPALTKIQETWGTNANRRVSAGGAAATRYDSPEYMQESAKWFGTLCNRLLKETKEMQLLA
ncbi:MAG TPA: hypothetical protein VGH01_06545 [Jatrophihabitantaceae bacterium]|jgi:hypothetical protein